MEIKHYNTGNLSEKVPKIIVSLTSDQRKGSVIYSIALPSLKAGTIIQAFGECEFTNDLSYLVSVVSGIILCDTPTTLVGGLEICEFNGPNVERTITHHSVHTKIGSIELAADIGPKYLNWVSYSASTAARANNYVTVGQDYGRLGALVFIKE